MRLPENTVRNVANRTRRYAATTPRLAFSNRRFVSVPLQGNTDKSAIGDSESLISTDKAGTGIPLLPVLFRENGYPIAYPAPLPHCNTFFTTV